MPNNPSDAGNTVTQQTDDQLKALKPALESMTLLVAAVIVHDKAANRVVLLQRSENAKFAQGMWDLPVGKSEPGEPITETAVRELYEETGLTVKPESLKVAHIIHGAWGVEAPNGFRAIPEAFVDTTASALHHYLTSGADVSLDGWQTA
ncbi:NUDIX domain-containing protein [Streptomyces sp. Root264]|uniref:NUDIX domain-containing protein n=1 Tax=Streptomyces sp. Root264 TaxID=1736503 RepID=UPI00070A25BC|nr:NUDIX domain-containing protein [Streptomyces sp. Root264]KRC95603.1 DNA mismatch repair protein MutT [Streptomyces sp. Root264]